MNTITYKIKAMQVTRTCIEPDKYTAGEKMQIHNSISFSMAVEDCSLLCRHELTLKSEEQSFCEIVLETTFSLSKDSVEGMKSNNKLEIPQGFLVQCGSISYGTLRGVVLKATNEKGLENIVIPPVFINTIIKEPMIIDLGKS